jgi:hypothetical protein
LNFNCVYHTSPPSFEVEVVIEKEDEVHKVYWVVVKEEEFYIKGVKIKKGGKRMKKLENLIFTTMLLIVAWLLLARFFNLASILQHLLQGVL